MNILLYYLLIINIAGFLSMLVDKQKAIHNKWRIPENTLMTISLIGGSLGALLGMYIFHHKTRHIKFKFGIPLILFLQIVISLSIFSNLNLYNL